MRKTARKGIYGLAARVEREAGRLKGKIKKREGAFGEIAGKVGDAIEAVAKQASEMHQVIKKEGGYIAAAKRTGKSIADTVRKMYDSLENGFFTDGEFDSEKAKESLSDSAEAVRKYGEKTYRSLSDLCSRGAEAVRKDYRDYIPTEQERNTTYAGIGTSYDGILLREHYENCLSFYKEAGNKMPKGTRYRKEILNDIKANAVGNRGELVKLYCTQIGDEENTPVLEKIKTTQKYI